MDTRRLVPGVLAAAFSSLVPAVTLPPSEFVTLPGTSVASEPHLAGTVVEDLLTPFAFTLNRQSGEAPLGWAVSGNVESRVVQAEDGTFDFYWRVLPDVQYQFQFEDRVETRISPTLPLSDFHVGSFNVPVYRADWRFDGTGEAAPRQAGVSGDTVSFRFGEIVAGEFYMNSTLRTGIDSYYLFIDTDARAYSKSGTFFFTVDEDDCCLTGYAGASGSYATFAPIPEPATWALMLAGLACLVRRRQGAAAR